YHNQSVNQSMIFIEHSLCAEHCTKHLRGGRLDPCIQVAYNIGRKKDIKINYRYRRNRVDFQIKQDIPEKDMKFTSFEVFKDEKRVLDISCLFQVTAQIPYELEEGQALITFEAEEVAQNVIKKGKYLVNLEDGKVELEAKPVPLKTGVTFQVHIKVSQKKINVSNIPEELPREQMRDKLELSFCKSHEGGSEVESMDYDPQAQTAVIMFLEAGVAENILRNKFQVFEGISRRTILLTGLKDIQEEEEDLEDLVHIHFQKERNGGGGVEVVKCALKQPLTVHFEEDRKVCEVRRLIRDTEFDHHLNSGLKRLCRSFPL
uniref:N-myc and STAT interactor n=1 Tax=Ornithorhynchus anatinus TaxID=9258 RepID=F6SH56_ORNAN